MKRSSASEQADRIEALKLAASLQRLSARHQCNSLRELPSWQRVDKAWHWTQQLGSWIVPVAAQHPGPASGATGPTGSLFAAWWPHVRPLVQTVAVRWVLRQAPRLSLWAVVALPVASVLWSSWRNKKDRGV